MAKKKMSKTESPTKQKTGASKNKKPAVQKKAAVDVAGQSRNHLMLEVKSRGIKNFRVMNKAELAEIVGGADPDRIAEIQKEAVARWKSGWGKKKQQ